MAIKKKTTLKLVPDPAATAIDQSRTFGEAGSKLWHRITTDFTIEDEAGRELLAQACRALDRAEACRQAIERDGEVVRGRYGLREHPLLRTELASRAFLARTLARLGLDGEG